VIGVILLVLLVAVWVWRRRARADRRAGLDASRPTFHIEPPGGHVRAKSRERL
jgi:hypothetical protein